MTEKTFRVLQVFCGLGGKGLGAKQARAVFGDASARFETIGGIDFDPQACRDFEMLVGAPTLCIDVHDLEPAQLRAFVGDEPPDAVMMSPPCKGFSGLLSAKRAREPKYERMNTLMLRALFLLCETWDRPPSLIFVENVPRITSRGKTMLRQCRSLLEGAGYAIAEVSRLRLSPEECEALRWLRKNAPQVGGPGGHGLADHVARLDALAALDKVLAANGGE